MFRKMRRFNQQLSDEECAEILKSEPRGVLAVHGENGYPYAFPMNFVYLNGKIYFHCAGEGHKLDAISKNSRVSFCVMDRGFRREGEWDLNIKSVVVFGELRKFENPEKAVEIVRSLGNKYYPSAEAVEREIEKDMPRLQLLELTVNHMTGKLVNES